MYNKKQVINLIKYFLFFYFFSAVYQSLCFISNISGFVGLRESFYMSFFWFIPILIFINYAKSLAAVIGIILWATSLFSLGYFILYNQEFSQSVIFIVFESNISESKEFLQTYFSWWIIPIFFIYTLIAYFIWKDLDNIEIQNKSKLILILFSLFITTFTFNKTYLLSNFNFDKAMNKQLDNMQAASPWNLIAGYIKYKQDLNQMENLLSKNSSIPPLNNMKVKMENQPNTLVLVIGESTNRNRMSLYGYNRETTPILDAKRNDLLVFDNVFSARPYTIEILQQALTFADEENPNLYISKPNILNIMKQAGYTTYWVTNQQTQTTRNTMLTTFSKMADNQIYLNNNRRQNSSSYDEVILEPFKQIMDDKNIEKKFIVLHLLGAHARYDYRYPSSFSKFDNQKTSQELNEKETTFYNYYDDAIYYNDFIISSIINIIENNNNPSSMLYFSDHGEEVFDDLKQKKMGRNEQDPTSAMYTVPFIIYGNKEWKQLFNLEELKKFTHRVYSTSNLLHTFCDLAGISFDEFEPQKSIINEDYKILPILIGDPLKKGSLRNLLENPL